jgi:hypothetical protein
MAVQLPNGVTLALATTYGSALTVSSATNASPTVLTSTAHGLANGDFVEVTSGWSRANSRIFRVSSVATNTFALEGFDTTSTTQFPSGSGVGSVRKITAFTQISQVLETTSSGGESQFATYSFLEDDYDRQLPTTTSAQSLSLSIADDQTLAGFIALRTASNSRTATALRASLPNGSVILYNGIVSMDETPSFTKNQVMAVKASFSLQGKPVRY